MMVFILYTQLARRCIHDAFVLVGFQEASGTLRREQNRKTRVLEGFTMDEQKNVM